MTSPFVDALQRLLDDRGLSWRALAKLVHYDPSWLSKVRNGAQPSEELVRRIDQALDAGGSLVALAAAEGTIRPAQLPMAPSRFVGRMREECQIREALQAPGTPVVVIEGPPGTGKTALSLHCAHLTARADPKPYPDGQLFADLHGFGQEGNPARPGDVVEEFLVALGVPAENIPPEAEQREKVYRSVLASRRVLIVLDNAASSDQVEPLLPGSDGCGVVVTSRKRLSGLAMRSDAVPVFLGPMSEDESVRLLRTVIGAERVAAEPEATQQLAARCGYLPLALRIAAERAATHPYLPLSALVDELASEEQRLEGLTTSNDSIAVRTAFEWSYRDLSAEAARMFRLIALHRGPHISASGAAAMAGVPIVQTRRLLERLLSVHLLEGVDPDRYRFHDLLRAYGVERAGLEESEEERALAVRRLTDWYLHSAQAASVALAPQRPVDLSFEPPAPDVIPLRFDAYDAALTWCEAELPNFLPITSLALQQSLYGTAWRLPIVLWNYFLLRSPWRVWTQTHLHGMTAAQRGGDQVGEAWTHNNLAYACRAQREFEQAERHYVRALSLRRGIGDRLGQAWTLTGLGFMAIDRTEGNRARTCFLLALPLFEELGDRYGQAVALATLGGAEHGLERFDEALEHLERARSIFADLDDDFSYGYALAQLGELHGKIGQPDQALGYLDQSLAIRKRGRRSAGSSRLAGAARQNPRACRQDSRCPQRVARGAWPVRRRGRPACRRRPWSPATIGRLTSLSLYVSLWSQAVNTIRQANSDAFLVSHLRPGTREPMIEELESGDSEYNANPYPTYARLRGTCPARRVYFSDGLYGTLVTRYEDVRAVLADAHFSKDPRRAPLDWQLAGRGRPLEDRSGLGTHLLTTDPPQHTRLRRVASTFFTRPRIDALRPRVKEIADSLIDVFASNGESYGAFHGKADLIADFAAPLQSTVISEILGIPAKDRRNFARWADDVVSSRPDSADARADALRHLTNYIAWLMIERRHRPGEDLVSTLVTATDEAVKMTEQEILSEIFLLVIAGYETTVNLIGNGLLALLLHPDQLELLRGRPSLAASAVEELLRYDGPVETATWRFPTRPVQISGGTVIPADEPVLVVLGAADRDPDAFPDPDKLDITRADNPHLAFGLGVHYCLGAPLARMEGQIALKTLLGRLSRLSLAVPRSALEWRRSLTIRGLQALPVTFVPVASDSAGRRVSVESTTNDQVGRAWGMPPWLG